MKKTILFLMIMLFTASLVFGVTLPHTENFDGVTAPNLPTGWAKIDDTEENSYGQTGHVKTVGYGANSEPNCVEIYNFSTTSGSGNAMLISPALESSITTTRVTFWGRVAGYHVYTGNLIIGTMSDPADSTTFTAVTTVAVTDEYSEYTVAFTGAPSGDKYVVFKHAMDVAHRFIRIDDFSWEVIPPTPIFSVSPESFDFGIVNLGSSSTKTFTVTNIGGGTFNVTAAAIADRDDASQFSVDTSNLPVALGVNESVAIDVTYAPDTEGVATVNLVITDDIARATHEVDITGTCQDLNVSLPYTQKFDGVTAPDLPIDWA
ncbi:MAG: choice-of-anchor D domain-containing protein, partial [Candidatus Cloacimonetes bacterium]|nr:choice-of-anchor D domain-containing protein [Candidatus Cloacimonadota bacterium]